MGRTVLRHISFFVFCPVSHWKQEMCGRPGEISAQHKEETDLENATKVGRLINLSCVSLQKTFQNRIIRQTWD